MHVLVLTIERSYYVHGTNTIIINDKSSGYMTWSSYRDKIQ